MNIKVLLSLPLILGTVACSSTPDKDVVKNTTFMGIEYEVNCETKEARSGSDLYTRETFNDGDPMWDEASKKAFDTLYNQSCN